MFDNVLYPRGGVVFRYIVARYAYSGLGGRWRRGGHLWCEFGLVFGARL